MANATCSIDGCSRPAVARTWCPAHWQRWKSHGDPLGGGPAKLARAVDWPDGTRTCSTCEQRKPLEQFDRVKNATRGRRSNCKQCRSLQMKALYRKRRDAIKARVAQHRLDNIDAVRAYDRARNDLPQRRELHAQRTLVRRMRMKSATVDRGVTRANLRAQYGDDCFYCGVTMNFARRPRTAPMPPHLATVDHVYPVALGGSHTWDNTVLACLRCNTSKRDSILSDWLARR